jgi:hypothetical protein
MHKIITRTQFTCKPKSTEICYNMLFVCREILGRVLVCGYVEMNQQTLEQPIVTHMSTKFRVIKEAVSFITTASRH